MSTFFQRSYHRKCQRRGVGGQKKPKSGQRSLCPKTGHHSTCSIVKKKSISFSNADLQALILDGPVCLSCP